MSLALSTLHAVLGNASGQSRYNSHWTPWAMTKSESLMQHRDNCFPVLGTGSDQAAFK
jgi:hypothetical protein